MSFEIFAISLAPRTIFSCPVNLLLLSVNCSHLPYSLVLPMTKYLLWIWIQTIGLYQHPARVAIPCCS